MELHSKPARATVSTMFASDAPVPNWLKTINNHHTDLAMTMMTHIMQKYECIPSQPLNIFIVILIATSDLLTSVSFHFKRFSHSRDMNLSKFDFEKVKIMGVVLIRSHVVGQASIRFNNFCLKSIRPPIPILQLFQIWPWKSKVNVIVWSKIGVN